MEVGERSRCGGEKYRYNGIEFEAGFEDGQKIVREANKWGTKQGVYAFRKMLGVSTFGCVLLGKRGKFGPLVAVTLLQIPSKASSPPRIEEMEKFRSLSHVNVVGLIDCYICHKHDLLGTVKKKCHQPLAVGLVMQHCLSGDLSSFLHKYRVNETTRLRWYRELTSGLLFLHNRGVCHWDLNPGNVWVEDDSLKLAYGGIAGVMWETYSKECFGEFISRFRASSPFTPPEAWNGIYDEKSDVFSLGLLFLVIAESPEEGFFLAKWGDKTDYLGHLTHESIPPRDILPTHMLQPSIAHARPQELRLFNEMLKYSPHDRPNTASLLYEHLDMKLGGSNSYDWTKWCAC